MIQLVIAIALFGMLWPLLTFKPKYGVIACLAYLAGLGAFRRWIEFHFGPVGNDPLLLVIPSLVFLTAFELQVWHTGGTEQSLTRAARALLIAMLIQAINPLQAGISVGLAGLMFYVVPLLWFAIARKIATPALLRGFLYVIAGIAILAAAYGLYQTWFGFTLWENAWMEKLRRTGSYEALNVGVVRAFSFFTAASEYASFLGLGAVILWSRVLGRHYLALLPLALLALALFLESSRGIIVLTLFACMLMWAVQSRTKAGWLRRGSVALCVGIAGMTWLIQHLGDKQLDDRIHPLVEHQVSGLSDPFGEDSTASGHVARIWYGLAYGITHPWGAGLGATTLAAGKFGGRDLGTEGDVSNLFVSLGVIGGVIYGVFIFRAFRTVIRLWQATRSEIPLAILGILAVQILNWLNTSQYSTVMLIWFCLGSADLFYAQLLHKRSVELMLARHSKPSPHESSVGYA